MNLRTVTESPRSAPDSSSPPWSVPLWEHPEWRERFPWLVQGTTGEGDPARPFDLSLYGGSPARDVLLRWSALREAAGAARVVHGHQVHGATVRVQAEGGEGLHVSPATDGHVTRTPGTLLAISVADCVPVSLVAEDGSAGALRHAGWRGAAAGILERGLEMLHGRLFVRARDLHLHLGPSICGACYEVGPEVHEGLGLDVPAGPTCVDLRAVLARRAVAAGIPEERITASSWCTRCGDGARVPFFSHRGGRAERQMAVLGIAGA